MASRLITTGTAAAQPLVWRGTADAGRVQSAAPTSQTRTGENEPERVLIAQLARIQELERELELRPRKAYEQGYAEGQAAGAKQANSAIEPMLAKLGQSLQELAGVRRKHLLDSEQDALRLAIAVAKKVLNRELSVDPESLLGIVKAAFERMEARDILSVRLHPNEAPVVERYLAASGMPSRIEVIPDHALERGSVIVETSRGSLDASASTQLREIERGLVDVVRRSS